jgi:membrane fusion protein (multidrug efflux system)
MKKRMFIMIGAFVLLVAVLAIVKVLEVKAAIAKFAAFGPAPAAVTSSIAKAQTWQPVMTMVGSMRAVNGVLVSTDLAGIVSQISFESGSEVKKGDLLVKLDTRQEEAQLHSAEAKRELARISQDDAAVEEAQALIARKTIVAPFDGLAGIRQVDLGQYLNVGSTIAPLQSIDPIYVEFSVPQQDIDKVVAGKKLRIRADGIGDREFDGFVTAIDSKVDEATRNITVQGTVQNPDHLLRPGMYVNVDVLLPEQQGVVAIPSTAIEYAPYGDSVFIIKDAPAGTDGKPAGKIVVQQFVKLGATRGDQVAVLSGVSPGDEIVTSGVFKLRSHAPVQVNNSVQPDENPNPNPPDT